MLLVGTGCDRKSVSLDQGIYMLLDTSGTYTMELEQAQRIINFTLATLKPGDTFAIARIDSGSFSERDIIHRQTFDTRPSTANGQKQIFRKAIDDFVKTVKSSQYTDITGGLLQGIQYLNESGAGTKTLLIFSDLREELAAGYKRDFKLNLEGFVVIAVNVTKLRADNYNPQIYMDRIEMWKNKVESGGGEWRVINDLERLEPIFKRRATE
ncbi:MAG TPA: VWA domain-containing protein [Gammaproteobacteria bacterium]|nr:VWA domain-containing protein [Gammaproteobacteria bacterium]